MESISDENFFSKSHLLLAIVFYNESCLFYQDIYINVCKIRLWLANKYIFFFILFFFFGGNDLTNTYIHTQTHIYVHKFIYILLISQNLKRFILIWTIFSWMRIKYITIDTVILEQSRYVRI